MTRTVNCVKLGKEAEGLATPPWQLWLRHQTILINEHRISPIDPDARKFLETEMEKFFFGGGSEMPGGFVSPDQLK
jgi:Fe-S cluster biosynthesis and repair protein YggX